MVAKFELNQKLNLKYMGITVPSIITKRIKVENLDTGTYEIYYDYKHDIPNGYSFPQVPEEHLNEIYLEALNEYIEKLVNK